MTVTVYPAAGDLVSVGRGQQSRLPMPRTQPLTRPLTQPFEIRAGTDVVPVPTPGELAEPGAVMNPADRIAWHVHQAQASRSKAGQSGAIGDRAQRLKEARASVC
jgi:hypothetical protein